MDVLPGGNSTSKGEQAEELACRYLSERGLKTLARNYRSRGGELDLVMRERDTVVFVEVRYRRNSRFGSAAESVDGRKQQRLIRCAMAFLQDKPALASHPARFDVISIQPSAGGYQVEWIRDAFAAL